MKRQPAEAPGTSVTYLKKANQIKIKAAKSEHPITYSGRPCERSGFFKCVRAFSKFSREPVAFFDVPLVFLSKSPYNYNTYFSKNLKAKY